MIGRRLLAATGVLALVGGLIPTGWRGASPAQAAPVPAAPQLELIEQARPKYRPVYHRPGQRGKFQDLQTYAAAIRAGKSHDEARAGKGTPHAVLLASGAISNPMQGNMILLPSDQVGVLVETDKGMSPWWVDTDSSGNPFTGGVAPPASSAITAKGGVAADLNGDGIQELVQITSPQSGCLTVQAWTVITVTTSGGTLNGFSPSTLGPCQSYDNSGKAAIVAGPFFPGQTGGDQVALAYASNNRLTVVLFDGPSFTPVNSVSTSVSSNAEGMVALVRGDFGGDGTYELAVAYGTSDGFEVQVVTVSATGALAFAGSLSSKGQAQSLELAAGDITGDGADEVVVFARPQNSGCDLAYLTVTPASSGSGFTLAVGDATVAALPSLVPGACTGTVGAFVGPLSSLNPPALQIAVGSTGLNSAISLVLYNVNTAGKLSHLAKTSLDESVDGEAILFFAAGTLNFSESNSQRLMSQIIFGWKNGSTAYLGAVQATSSGTKLSYIGKTSQPFHFGGSGEVRPIAGDFLGRSIRLGPPTYHVENSILQIQALIYEPPQHIDVFSITDTQRLGLPTGPITYNINYNTDPNDTTSNATWIQFINAASTVSQTTVSYGNSFQLSNDFAIKFEATTGPVVNFSLKTYGGADFTSSQQHYAQTSWQIVNAVAQDTLFVYTAADYQVWEYPILGSASGSPAYVSVIYPIPNDPLGNDCFLLKSCVVSGGQPQSQSAKDFPIWFPDHEPGNLMSWNWPNTVTPPDVGVSFFDSGPQQVDNGPSWSMSFQTVNQRNQGTSWNVGVDLTVGGGYAEGIPDVAQGSVTDTFNGQYTHQGNSTQQQQFSNSTTVNFNYPASNQDAGYQARSYVYWSSASTSFPQLRVTWTTVIDPSTDPFWQVYYNQPDFTFNLRTRDRYSQNVGTATEVAFLNVQTPDLVVSPAVPVMHEPATITATVRNYAGQSYSGAPVAVNFYDGNPATGGLLIASSGFSSIAAFGTTQVSVQWTPTSPGVHTVYAVIVPPSGVSETHTDNNTGAAQMSVVPGDASLTPAEDDPALRHNGNHAFGATVVHRIGSAKTDLEIVPGSVRVSGAGANRTLSAKVRAINGHFANVHVQFFDGDPKRTGRLIGSQSIPLVWAGRTATASMRLPVLLPSDRPFFARILFFPRVDSLYHNNQEAVSSSPAPADRRYIPAAPFGANPAGDAILPGRPPSTTRRRAKRPAPLPAIEGRGSHPPR